MSEATAREARVQRVLWQVGKPALRVSGTRWSRARARLPPFERSTLDVGRSFDALLFPRV
jgi:hypothetical protein